MTGSKRLLRYWSRLAFCDEVYDVWRKFVREREHGVVSHVICECQHVHGRGVVLLAKSGSAQWQYGRGDHRVGVNLLNDGHRDEENGALVQHAQENDELLRGAQERGDQERGDQGRGVQ